MNCLVENFDERYEKARLRAFEMKEEDRKTFAHSITAV